MRFWDSSGVVPLLIRQPLTSVAEATFENDAHLSVWWGTSIECVSALARLEREGGITAGAMTSALDRLRRLSEIWDEVQPSTRVRHLAERLLRSHPLRGADALQLAAAIEVGGDAASGIGFVCFDRRLAQAAGREGFTVIGVQD